MKNTGSRSPKMADFDEVDWWGTCGNTYHEEQKQLAYASRMGLLASWQGAHPPEFNLAGRSTIDIGGGPTSLLLKCIERGRSVVADPAVYPDWVFARYEECDIEYWRQPGEEISGYSFDEAWIYNTLQHVENPEAVIENARNMVKRIRLFEWIDVEPYEGHPHKLTEDYLNDLLDGPGYVANVNETGAVGRAYYGVFSVKSV